MSLFKAFSGLQSSWSAADGDEAFFRFVGMEGVAEGVVVVSGEGTKEELNPWDVRRANTCSCAVIAVSIAWSAQDGRAVAIIDDSAQDYLSSGAPVTDEVFQSMPESFVRQELWEARGGHK